MRQIIICLILIMLSCSVCAIKPEKISVQVEIDSSSTRGVNIEPGELLKAYPMITNINAPTSVTISILKEEGLVVMRKQADLTPENYKTQEKNLELRFSPALEVSGTYLVRLEANDSITAEMNIASISYIDPPLGGDRGGQSYSHILEFGRSEAHLSGPDQKIASLSDKYLDLADSYLIQIPKEVGILVRILPSDISWIGMAVYDMDGVKLYERTAARKGEPVGALLRSTKRDLENEFIELKLKVFGAPNKEGGGPYAIELSSLDNSSVGNIVENKGIIIHPVFESGDRERPTVKEDYYSPKYLFLLGLLSIIALGLAVSIYYELVKKKNKEIDSYEERIREMALYISRTLDHGYPTHAIQEALKAARWTEEEIERGFAAAMNIMKFKIK